MPFPVLNSVFCFSHVSQQHSSSASDDLHVYISLSVCSSLTSSVNKQSIETDFFFSSINEEQVNSINSLET